MFGKIVAFVAGLFAPDSGFRVDAPSPSPAAPVGWNTVATGTPETDRAKLFDLLDHPDYDFRRISTLARKIGTTDNAYLAGLLDSIGTRRAYRNPELVGLIAKVGSRPRRWHEIG